MNINRYWNGGERKGGNMHVLVAHDVFYNRDGIAHYV